MPKKPMDALTNKEKLTLIQPYRLALLVVAFFLSFAFNITTGSMNIPISNVLYALFGDTSEGMFYQIIWDFRLPKSLTCILAGAGLGTGGLMMQTFFRNPLAGPDVLGLSSGASLMVAVAILWQGAFTSIGLVSLKPWGVASAATFGALLVFIISLAAARRIKENSSLLIVGMMVAAFTSSLVSVLQFLSKADDLQAFMIWSLGSVGGTNWDEINVMLVAISIGLLIAFNLIKPLNVWFLGENYSASIGINVKKSRLWIVFSTSLMVGSVTAFCGPIAFVGLAVPHLVKLIIPSTNHKILLPAVALGGAVLLLVCDTALQLRGDTQMVPLNAVTSFIGAPVLIWVVLRNKKN